MPAGQLGGGEPYDIGDESHARPGREDELLLGLVLLQNVVLDGARQRGTLHSRLVGHAHVHGHDHRGGRVDGHGGAHGTEVDPGEQRLHVGQGVDGDPGPPHFALGQGIVGVPPQQGGHVEGGRQAVATGAEQLLEAAVGVLRRSRSRRTVASSTAASGTWTRTVHGCRGTGRAAPRRAGRRRVRVARPTWSRIAPSAWVNDRRSPAMLPRSAICPYYFDIKVNPSAQSKSPAARRKSASESKRARSAGCVQPQVGEDLCVHGGRGPLGHAPALGRDGGQRAPPVVGVGTAGDQALEPRAGRRRW